VFKSQQPPAWPVAAHRMFNAVRTTSRVIYIGGVLFNGGVVSIISPVLDT
jgi:hypothetical protein